MCLCRQRLGIAVLELAGADQALDLVAPDGLDLVGDLEAVQLARQGGDLVGVDLALDELDVAEAGGRPNGAAPDETDCRRFAPGWLADDPTLMFDEVRLMAPGREPMPTPASVPASSSLSVISMMSRGPEFPSRVLQPSEV